jgi:hypothetical protein
MRSSGVCPKCASVDILRVPGTVEPYGAGSYIPAGAVPMLSGVRISRYVCGTCGFIEHWVDTQTEVDRLRSKYGTAALGSARG